MYETTPDYADLNLTLHAGHRITQMHTTKQKNVEAFLVGSIRQLFLDHNAHETYGVSLLHKHFPITSTEASSIITFHSLLGKLVLKQAQWSQNIKAPSYLGRSGS